MPNTTRYPLRTITCQLRNALAICIGLALVVACSGLSLSTQVLGTWKDPKYASEPLKKIFVISLMKVEPGGRDAVEDAVIARLASAGVAGVASHTVMSNDPQRPGPTLPEAIRACATNRPHRATVQFVDSPSVLRASASS